MRQWKEMSHYRVTDTWPTNRHVMQIQHTTKFCILIKWQCELCTAGHSEKMCTAGAWSLNLCILHLILAWISFGNVAENISVCLSPVLGITSSCTIRLICGSKPISNMRSASSKTRYLKYPKWAQSFNLPEFRIINVNMAHAEPIHSTKYIYSLKTPCL
jgi:hypothetical protein